MNSGVVVVVVFLILGGVSRLVTDSETSWKVVGGGGATWDAHGTRCTANRRADGHTGGKGAVGGIETRLDKILALWLGNKGLELGGGEGVYEASLRDNK